jgi:rhamnogalacturonan endolyase
MRSVGDRQNGSCRAASEYDSGMGMQPRRNRRRHDRRLTDWRRAGRLSGGESLEPRRLLTTTTLFPVADTFTRAGVNAGAAQTLVVQDANGASGDAMAYLRFDLTGVDLTGLTNAYLTLQKIGGDTIVTGRFDVFGLRNVAGNTPQDWNESTLATAGLGAEYTATGGDKLDPTRVVNLDADGTAGADVIEQVSNSGSPQHLSGVDLVRFLRDRQADGGLATFITLVDAGASRGWSYGSRENATAALRPTLRLEYVPAYEKAVNPPARQMEALDRGLIALRRATSQVYLGWRLLGTDPSTVGFNVYRSANGGTPVKLTTTPLTSSTNYVDTTFNAAATNTYSVRPVLGGVEQPASQTAVLAPNAPIRQYLNVPLDIPPGGQMPDVANPGQFVSYTYTANDASVGDLDGDGDYEIVLKWMPTNEAHAGAAGYTGSTILDAYRLDGTRLWRIDLGINIRSSAQYAPFLVYDLDGDGRAEVVTRTMPGTTDGRGADVVLPGDDPDADYRTTSGRIVTGPEYLTVFDGLTGGALATVPFAPDRQAISTWGDDYGHRGENLFLAPAYLDGVRPSIVVGRGIYSPSGTFPVRNEVTAWDWRDGQLTRQWWFKAAIGVNGNVNSEYVGQGTHSMITADVDGDGRDEVVYGAMTVDHDGTGLYSTGRGHGDALHVSDMDPSNPGLEVFQAHEETALGNHTTSSLRDAATGRILAAPLVSAADVAAGSFPDVGRAIALDIDPNHPGYEFWNSYDASIFDVHGTPIAPKPSNMHVNFGVWWDGDLLRETLDNTTISDWNHTTHSRSNLVSFASSGINNSSGLAANNGTKSTPCLSGDILGDWREEVIWRTSDNTALQIWSTTITAGSRIPALMHDPHYRLAIAWQNNGYNQPPNPGFFLGAGMAAAPTPAIYTVARGLDDHVITVAAGQTVVDPAVPAGTARLVKRGAGTLTLTAESAHAGGTLVEAGQLVVRAAAALGSGGLDVRAGAEVVLAIPSSAETLSLPALTLAPGPAGGRLDVGGTLVTVASGLTAGGFLTHVLAGRGDGSWGGGAGITSSAVAEAVARGESRAVGWIADAGGSLAFGFAAAGDTNLDRSIDILDTLNVLAGGRFNAAGGATWSDGDFNYDGVVDMIDVADLIGTGLYGHDGYGVSAAAPSPADEATGLSSVQAAFAALALEEPATSAEPRSRLRR